MTRKEAEKRARALAHYQAKGAIHTHEQKKTVRLLYFSRDVIFHRFSPSFSHSSFASVSLVFVFCEAHRHQANENYCSFWSAVTFTHTYIRSEQ